MKLIDGENYEFVDGKHTAYGSYSLDGFGGLNHAPTQADIAAIAEILNGMTAWEISRELYESHPVRRHPGPGLGGRVGLSAQHEPSRAIGVAMTTIQARKPRRSAWQTNCSALWKGSRRLAVTVALHPDLCLLRLKGTRTEYGLPWSTLYQLAVKASADAARRAKSQGKPRLVSRGRV